MLTFLSTFFYFILVLTILVFIHEFGHYFVAKKCGVKIEEFAIGMGKKLFGFKDKNGVEWKFCLFPIGGYVKMYGDNNASSFGGYVENPSEDLLKYSLIYKHPIKKILVSFAGPFMNLLLGFVVFCFIFFAKGQPIPLPVIGDVVKNSCAEKSGLIINDRILSVNGKKVETFPDFITTMKASLNNTNEVELKILRNGQTKTIIATYDKKNNMFGVGSSQKHEDILYKKTTFFQSILYSWNTLSIITTSTMKAMYNIVFHQKGMKNIGGPIAIAKQSTKAASAGFYQFLNFLAIFSVGLGVINLIPIAPLDGGHIVIDTIELITRRKFSNIAYKVFVVIGFVFVSFLMGLGFINDIFINR